MSLNQNSDYEDFMNWFKENHPKHYMKYARNIVLSPRDGKTVAVNNGFKISNEEFDELNKIANSYYEQKH